MIAAQESITAKLCSFARAYHSNTGRKKIFDDYLAYDLMGKEEFEEIGQLIQNDFEPAGSFEDQGIETDRITAKLNRYIAPIPLSRIAFAEQRLVEFAEKYDKCQYVICGAGMDTFAFRNNDPRIRIFELDHPDTGRYKRERIRKLEWNIPQGLTFVPIDFSRDDMTKVLPEAGYDPDIPTFFAILGVSYYLTLPVFEQTIKKISQLCRAEVKVVFDYPDETTLRTKSAERVHTLAEITERLGEKMLHGYSYSEISTVLDRYGFEIEDHETPQMIQQHYFEDRDDGIRAFENIHFMLAYKEKEEMKNYIFTSESVTKGHPDKVCDMISDAILDAYIKQDKNSRVAVETVVKNNNVVLAGEVSSSADVDIERTVRDTINNIGYDRPELGFDGHTVKIIQLIDKQSPDIAQGVDDALEHRGENKQDIGAGDQGMVFGYAVNETEELMPAAISLAHKLSRRLTEVRENGTLPYLRPDGKTQVSVKYEDGRPVGIDTVLISTQHDPQISQEQIRNDLIKYVIRPALTAKWINDDYKVLINPTGRFVIGGPVGDSGLTGRKIIVDTYGGAASHGGGAFSGKDPTKVDRSAAYAARYIAKNIVSAGLAEKAEIQIAYAIGVAHPVSVLVNTFGTGKVSDDLIRRAVENTVDLRPSGIIRRFDLQRPIYAQTASYGHFGRTDVKLPWEKTDLALDLKRYIEYNTREAV